MPPTENTSLPVSEPAQLDTTPVEPTTAAPVATAEPKTSKFGFLNNKKSKLALLIVSAVALIACGSAAAYYGVIVPNKPENILKTAVEKQLQKKQQSTKGTIVVDMKDETAEIKNVNVDFTAQTDSEKQTFGANLDVSFGGAKLPLELRGIDKSVFLKVGDLGSVRGLVAAAGGEEAASMVDAIGDKVNNQWIEFDESLLKQANTSCSTDLATSLIQQDIDQIMKLYSDNSFVTVKGTSSEKVDSRDVTKYDLDLDKAKAQAFGEQLDQVEFFKRIAECTKTDDEATGDIEEATEDAAFSFAVWVDGDKNLRQVQIAADNKEAKGTFTMQFTDDAVNVQKPEGAKPLMEVFGDFSQMFGTSLEGLDQAADGSSIDAGLSEECTAAYQNYAATGDTAAISQACL